MCCQLKADDDRVAVMVVENVRDGDQLESTVRFHCCANHEVLVRQLLHALPPSASQLDHRPAEEPCPSPGC